MAGHTPERTCVVTREKGPPKRFVRLVRGPDGVVYVDYRARLPGRGAWVLPRRDALEKLEAKPRILNRALRGPADTSGLLERVRVANVAALQDALSIAARSGALHGGKDRVRLALGAGALGVALAADASPRLVEDLRRRAGGRPVLAVGWTAAELGALVGKGPRAALAVLAGKPGAAVLRELRRFSELR